MDDMSRDKAEKKYTESMRLQCENREGSAYDRVDKIQWLLDMTTFEKLDEYFY